MRIEKSAARGVFERLYGHYGPQAWWPANSVFEVMLGAVLIQNTAWRNVEHALANLKQHSALSLRGVDRLSDAVLARCLRPSGCFNVKTRRVRALCEWLRTSGGIKRLQRDETEQLRADLLAVHGIGRETADAILLYGLQRPVFVIDTYTRRLLRRLGWGQGNEPYEALRNGFEKALPTNVQMYNEYHALIVAHGKQHCRSTPLCKACCLRPRCKYPASLA